MINKPKYKKGICQGNEGYPCRKNQPTYIFARGRCLDCYRVYSQSKYQKKRKPTGEKSVFEKIWIKRKHVSFLSKRKIDGFENTDMWVNCFAHVLSKRKYPNFRLNEENIVLLHPDEHFLLDQGTEQQRQDYEKQYNCSWQRIYDKQNELKVKYEQ